MRKFCSSRRKRYYFFLCFGESSGGKKACCCNPSQPTSNAGQPVQKVFGEHGERIVVATKGLAGGAAQARVVAPGVAAAARGVVPLLGNNSSCAGY
jgi:hypothetical protein